VKWFNEEKGYGMIGGFEGTPDVVVYSSAIQGDGFKVLTEGQLVEYEIVQGQKGPIADKVVRLAEAAKEEAVGEEAVGGIACNGGSQCPKDAPYCYKKKCNFFENGKLIQICYNDRECGNDADRHNICDNKRCVWSNVPRSPTTCTTDRECGNDVDWHKVCDEGACVYKLHR